ncbi:hypothetical protein MTo_01655 [Microcystis aeruginosa NIES-1211]|uniref:Uncharacterized protein n=1 Tax=Microcystis aeruginosa NIES-2519 TaxID=2303981 RepID=A0A5A5R4U1_MICAE|nr:hypothetical protein MTo_01655 [Microcystis aeruginosa NIES-1211]GCA71394.1 hypothetical protein MiYa_02933 [Microcystis aeruginosa NIES-2519]GCA84842.1 hypothetical protein MiHa_02817 [Microcystis aeruginosa NIES-2522]GCA89240.1 hypothetical protein MiTa_02590 [Microcystis aeruginosa NIES-4264]CCI33783.1 hypothetical protein MICAI_450010 [Microcystis sp. T1-4]
MKPPGLCRPPSLTLLGRVEVSQEITDETRQIDLFFSPHPAGQITVDNLGLLGQIALNSTLLEPCGNTKYFRRRRSRGVYDVIANLSGMERSSETTG